MTDTSTLTWYDENAASLVFRYKATQSRALHQIITHWIRVVELGD